QEGWHRLLQALVERQHLPGDFGADGACVITLLDVAIALEHVDDWEVGRRFAVGYRGTLQHQPALSRVAMDEFVGKSRLPKPRLAHHGHHLAMPRPGLR